MTVYEGIWTLFKVYEGIWKHMKVYKVYPDIFKKPSSPFPPPFSALIRTYSTIFELIRPYSTLFDLIRLYLKPLT